MTRTQRPISARARILGAILAVACVGLAIVGGVTFLVQRERVLSDVDTRLDAQVSSMYEVANGDAGVTDASGQGTTRCGCGPAA